MRNLSFTRIASLFLLSAFIGLPLYSQSYLVRTYTENDGLASSTIHDLAQTPDGRIWFATRAGISVYDGRSWTTYSAPGGFPAVSVSKLAVDANGSLWAWGDNPRALLACFRDGRWERQAALAAPGEAIEPVGLVITGPPNRETAILGTLHSGVFLLRDGVWKRIRKSDGLASDRVCGMAADGDTIFAATDRGVTIIRNGTADDSLNRSFPILQKGVLGVLEEKTASGSRLWLAGQTWLARLSGGKFELMAEKLVTHVDDTHPNIVLSPDGTGGVFFGNPYALYHLQAAAREVDLLDMNSGLIAEGATSILLDREMNVWVASLRGLSKISGHRFANFRKVQGLLEDEVTAMARLKDGRIVFGHNSGLTFFDGRSFRPRPFPVQSKGQPTGTRVLDLFVDAAGTIWAAAAGGGLARISPDGSIRWFGREAGLVGQVSSVADAGNGRLLVTSNEGLRLFSGDRSVPMPGAASLPLYLRKIGITLDGRVFATSSSSGIYILGRDGWAQCLSPDSSYANDVFSAVDDGDRLLVGTMAGLYEVKDGRLRLFTRPGLRLERPVYLILREPGGALWFGTDNGAVRWDGRETRTYTIKQGFAGSEVNRSAGLVDGSGRVWIGTNTGVSRYHAEFDFPAGRIPPPLVSIHGIKAGGVWLPADRPLRLSPRRNNLEFEFQAITFVDENAVRYRYLLDGFDARWSDPRPAGEGLIRYTNLPPGHYVFRLRAENALGGWSDPIASPEIDIAAPLARHWWFYLLVGAVFLLLGYAAFQLVTEKRTARNLERQVRDRTAQIRTALEEKNVLLREIHHRVKNNLQIVSSLLSMQARKVKDPESLALFRESMDRIRAMALIHENLYRSESAAAIGAADYIRRLARDLMAAYALRAGNIGLELDVADVPMSPDIAFPCGLIINELVSNSLKHAFPEGRPGTIRIGLREDRGEYILTVADDGVGLPPGVDAEAGGSLGLRLVRKLAGQLGGALAIESGAGAEFIVRFPAGAPLEGEPLAGSP
ncbi:MAG: triple tyrosine motif-containing protein [Candidatus Aminicenantes bacterium]|nr:triple tyrosine motif-containing protein [Candidatus Aminicenantes bacterium]